MNHARARAVSTTLLAVAALLLAAASAIANVTPSIDVALDNTQLGAHAKTTVTMGFDYGGLDPVLYPPPSDYRETVNHVVTDIPAGLVGNPNAVPMAERCEPSVFETGTCPDSSIVGTFSITTSLLPLSTAPTLPGGSYPTITVGPDLVSGGFTRLFLLKTDPEVPATFGIFVKPPIFDAIRQKIQISPDVNSDLKLRTITLAPVEDVLYNAGTPFLRLRINQMVLTFLGTLPNGNAFMTNPTECVPWKSTLYANATYVNNNLDADPLGGGANAFKKAESTPIVPDCSNAGNVPFPISGTTTVSTNARDISPEFDFTITEPGLQANGQASSGPKKIVTTVPASINVDVQQLGRICESAQFDAEACPASTKVGTVAIETPLIKAGLAGDVYLVRNSNAVLPDLGMQINGAIKFRQRGTNRYVNTNQIETTFDNIPAMGFSKLNVHLFGGPNGLLRSLKCPTGNKLPQDGNFTYDFRSYSGQTNGSTTQLVGVPCFGIQKLRTFRCVYRVLRFQPTYTSRARLKKVVLYVDGKRVKTVTKGKFQFRVPAKKFKKGKHKFELRATYDDGTVSKKKSRFRRC